jgi:hypothetical protein
MSEKSLCKELIKADTENEVIEILKDAGYWDDDVSWRYYSGYENNYNTIGNQQSRPEAALVEKIVNSVDARLVSECLEKGIDPEGLESPRSITAAVSEFFDPIQSTSSSAGLIREWPDQLRTEVARGITVCATGYKPNKGNPSITISDCGEGQTPDMMPQTFLSTTGSNKMRIPFVQGKFNMGGTGVLQFCGERNLQLILTRRNPALIDPESASDDDWKWGFTIVRREFPEGGRRSSVYTYLAPLGSNDQPNNGSVIRFHEDEMPIFPDGRKAYARSSSWGTLIKLYEYQLGGSRSNILRRGGLLNRLDLMLPYVALPVRLHECRKGYRGHPGSFETTLTGLGVRLEDDKAENLEFEPDSHPMKVMGERMTVTVYAFKKGKEKTYKSDEGVIFLFNGQTHGHFKQDFFRRNRVGMRYIARSILLMVDCSEFSPLSVENTFMNSRDRLRDNDLTSAIESRLMELVKNHERLRELKEKRRREEVEEKLVEDKALEEVLRDLLEESPTLASLFLTGIKLPNPFKPKKVRQRDDIQYQGKRYPTYFRFEGKDQGEKLTRDCHIGSRARITFETDAVDDYFSRQVDTGDFDLQQLINGKLIPVQDYVLNLSRGIATLNLDLPFSTKPNNTISFVATVTDASRAMPFMNKFSLNVLGRKQKSTSEVRSRKKPPSNELGNGRETAAGIMLPKIRRIREEEWERQDPAFTEMTALRIKHAGLLDENEELQDVYDFFVNVDNFYLKTEQKQSETDPELVEAQFIYGMVILGLALIRSSIDEREQRIVDGSNLDPEDLVAHVSDSTASVILPMIHGLGELKVGD